MIGFIKGTTIHSCFQSQIAIIDCQGVGYEVHLCPKHIEGLIAQQETSLWIYTHVKEDQLILYGFLKKEEKELFRLLLNVSGLGPKSVMGMTQFFTSQEIVRHILDENSEALCQVPGVGKKTAQRIVLDLKQKIQKKYGEESLFETSHFLTLSTPSSSFQQDLISALINMGFPNKQAQEGSAWFLDQKLKDPQLDEALPQVLKYMTQNFKEPRS